MKPGDRIGSYEIIAPIDAGGMGVVYRARHTGLDREVAIKVLLPNLMLSEKIRDRFKQEAYVQAKLIHPNIVQVSDSIHTDEHSAIVMEYVEGGSLANKLDQKPGAWSEVDFRAVFGPIVEGVAYAHSRGVVHRDIKPENVLLTTDGIPKVADFGIAKILAGDSHMTRTGAKLGTIPYMAPEQYDGKTDLGTEADVYALGMLAWRMLTGDLPVDGDSAKAVYEHYTGAKALPSIAEEVQGLSPALARLIDGCLQVDRQQRPKDAGVMQKLLGAKEAPSAPPMAEDNPEIEITSGSVKLDATTVPNAPVEEVPKVVPDTVKDLEGFLNLMGIETNAPVEEMAEGVPDTVKDLEGFMTEMGIETEFSMAPPAPSSPQTSLGTGRNIGIVAAVVLIVGALLPWASTFGGSVNGTEGDGRITLVMGVIALVLLVLRKGSIWIPLVLGVLIALIGIIDYQDMVNASAKLSAKLRGSPLAELAKLEVGIGLYMTIVGGIGLAIGSIVEYLKKD